MTEFEVGTKVRVAQNATTVDEGYVDPRVYGLVGKVIDLFDEEGDTGVVFEEWNNRVQYIDPQYLTPLPDIKVGEKYSIKSYSTGDTHVATITKVTDDTVEYKPGLCDPEFGDWNRDTFLNAWTLVEEEEEEEELPNVKVGQVCKWFADSPEEEHFTVTKIEEDYVHIQYSHLESFWTIKDFEDAILVKDVTKYKVGDLVAILQDFSSECAKYQEGEVFEVVVADRERYYLKDTRTGGHWWATPSKFDLIEHVVSTTESDDVPVAEEDNVNHPSHYTSDPSGVECLEITRHRNFNIGNAIKYLWRAGLKQDADKTATAKQVEDLRKAIFYIEDEIKRIS